MKVVTENAVYVQKGDINYLFHSDMSMPKSIFDKVYGQGIVIINNNNKNHFIEFNEPEEIEFLKGVDWIVDYNEIRDLSEEEIIALGQSIAEEKNTIANKYNAMSSEEQEENKNMELLCELLDYKMYTLRDILWFKQGHIKMKLPKAIKQEKGIIKLVNTLFNKINK